MKIISYNNNKNKFKKTIFFISFFIILFIILIFSKTVHASVKLSINVLLSSLIPSLLPFLILSEFAINTDILNITANLFKNIVNKVFKISKNSSIAIIIGYLCGFPSGSKSVNTLYEKKLISRDEACILLSFVNNNNPAFIISAIGISVFGSTRIGVLLLASHFLSSLLIGIFYSRYYTSHNIIHEFEQISNKTNKDSKISENLNIIDILKKCILNALKTLATIFGFVMIFNLCFDILNLLFNKLNLSSNFVYVISAIIEITRGSHNIIKLNYSMNTIICLESFLLGFSGICIILQIYSTIAKNNFSFLKLLKYKFIHGILSAIITYYLLKYTNIVDVTSISIFNPTDSINILEKLNQTILYKSYIYYLLFVIFIIFIYIFYVHRNNRKNCKKFKSKVK